MVYQHGSPFYDEDEESCRVHAHGRPVTAFPSAECIRHIYQPALPDTGCLDLLPKKYHPLDDLNVKRWKERKIKTWYYTTNLHKGAFMLPKYVEDMLEEEEK